MVNNIISIVIPCRNEERYIELCLDSLIENDFDHKELEIFVVDGMSVDGTKDLIKKYVNQYSFIKLLENPRGVTPVAMNLGIKQARGHYIMILSSHSKVDSNFIKSNVESIEKYQSDCVGGTMLTLPANDSLLCRAIALAISHPFGVGNSYFRIGSKSQKYVDTVPFGCYKREVFKKIGFFDEDLVRNQDDEFNLRLIKSGGKILLVPEIISYYHARDSLLKLWKMYNQYGYFKPLVAHKVGGVLTWRQTIPAVFVGALITSGILSFITISFQWIFLFIILFYLFTNFTFSFLIGKKKGLTLFLMLPFIFPVIHVAYGLGYLKGIFDFTILRKHRQKNLADVPSTR